MQIDKTIPIGFVGIGLMGSRMASRLIDAGFPLHVYDRSPEKAEPLVVKGATPAATLTDLAVHSDVIISMLANDTAVEEIYLSEMGILSALEKGRVIIDCSSIRPETSQKLHAVAISKGIAMIDAPVSGSTPQAEEGNLIIYVGGEKETFTACEPIFRAIGKSWFYLGPSGSGTAMKLVVNDMLGIEMIAFSEAVVLGEKMGLPQEEFLNVLSQTAVIPPALKGKFTNIKDNAYPVNFPTRLIYKDMTNVLAEAAKYNLHLPLSKSTQETYQLGNDKTPNEDFSSVIKVIKEETL